MRHARLRSLGPELAWLVALFVPILVVKLLAMRASHDVGIDGALYLEVAKHVRDGEGLVTRLSLYNQGFTYFPHPSPIYPLFPLLVGYTARLVPLQQAGVYIAGLGYLASLLGMWAWGRRLFPGELFPKALPGLHMGHVGLFMLAVVSEYQTFTSMPYTDGLGAAFAIWGSARAVSILRAPSVRGGIELGVWAALSFLARSQLAAFALSIGVALLWGFARVPALRRAFLRCGLTFAATTALLLIPHALHVASGTDSFKLATLLEFHNARESDLLSKFEAYFPTHGLSGYLTDRLAGFQVAYGSGQHSYQKQFHYLQWLAPIAAFFFVVRGIVAAVRGQAQTALRPWLHLEAGRMHALCMGAVNFLLVHHVHKVYSAVWHFPRRHAALCVLLFWLGFAYLVRRARSFGGALAVFVICMALWSGTGFLYGRYEAAEKAGKPLAKRSRGLVQWLDREAKREPLTVAYEPWLQYLGVLTERVNYHWIERSVTTARDFEVLAGRLGVKYVLLIGSKSRQFEKKGAYDAFDKLFQRERVIDGVTIYRRRS